MPFQKGNKLTPKGAGFKKGHKDFVPKESRILAGKKMLGHKFNVGRKMKDDVKELLRNLMKGNKRALGHKSWNKGIRGKDSHSYKGGAKLIYKHYKNAEYKEWRKQVFERDDYTCQQCGCRAVMLHPHHIKGYTKYPEKRYEVSNGITLCVPCHHQTHWGH